tara:strand:+ start:75 stop:506 length:432 start_codon:yes stop_codon:yes gene_type:complete
MENKNNWNDRIKLIHINYNDFWYIYDEICDEICDEKCELFDYRSILLEAYKKQKLYGLRVTESIQMFENKERNNPLFCKNSWYLLPCFCVRETNKAIFIWTHERARKKGFAKKLVELLNIDYAFKPLASSLGFWEKCNVKLFF